MRGGWPTTLAIGVATVFLAFRMGTGWGVLALILLLVYSVSILLIYHFMRQFGLRYAAPTEEGWLNIRREFRVIDILTTFGTLAYWPMLILFLVGIVSLVVSK